MNEAKASTISPKGAKKQDDASPVTPSTGPASTVEPPAPVPGSATDTIVTAQQNVPILEGLALMALISGCLSMYWGITGMMVGGTVSAAVLMLFSQPMIFVHVLMSTCVVVLAPVVTVQKVQLRALGTLREQQNELRLQVNTLQQTNDALSTSITSIADQARAVDQWTQELQKVATATGTTTDRLLQLGTELGQLQQQVRQQLQAQVLQQIISATLRTDADRNFVVSEAEVHVLIQRLQQIPGIQLNERAFRRVLERSEPAGALTLADMSQLARALQENTSPDDAKEEAVFTFQPTAILAPCS